MQRLVRLSLKAELIVTSRESHDGVTSVGEIALPTMQFGRKMGRHRQRRKIRYPTKLKADPY